MTDYRIATVFALIICAMVAIGLMVSAARAECIIINGRVVCCTTTSSGTNCHYN